MEEVLVMPAMEDQDMQVEILRDLAPALSSPMRSRMLTFACALNKPSARAQVVTALAPQLSQDLLQVAPRVGAQDLVPLSPGPRDDSGAQPLSGGKPVGAAVGSGLRSPFHPGA